MNAGLPQFSLRLWALICALPFALACASSSGAKTDDHGHAHAAGEGHAHAEGGKADCCAGKEKDAKTASPETQAAAQPNDGTRQLGDVTTCPVSGETFTVSADSPKVAHAGGHYFLCCGGCSEEFKSDPVRYTGKM